MESRIWVVVVAALAFLCTIKGGLYALLLLDVACAAVFDGDWYLGSISFDSSEIVFGTMAVLVVAGRRPDRGIRLRDIPGFRWWVFLGLLSSWAYLAAPMNASRLTDPVRICYQLYRYCWKPILLYPLVILLVGTDSRRARTLLMAVLVVASYTAGSTLLDYLEGGRSATLISGKNRFAGSLVAPTIACLALLLSVPAGRNRWLLLGGLGVLSAGLVAAGSRGAIVAAGAAGIGLVFLLARFAGGRRRLMRLAGWGIAGLLVVLLLAPDVTQLPGVRLLSELQQGTEVSTLTWRTQLRWPRFWARLMTSPWLGIGTDRDPTLTEAPTPHNGYLSLALISGLPVAVITALFGLRAVWVARGTFLRRGDTRIRLLALGTAAAVGGLLVHNIVESTIIIPYVSKLYWLLVALALGSPLLGSESPARSVLPTTARRRRASGRIPVRPLQPTTEAPPG